MAFYSTTGLIAACACSKSAVLSIYHFVHIRSALGAVLFFLERPASPRNGIYNLLWAVVFGFATLNILSLAGRRFEPNRRGMTFGELMAVMVVLLSVFLLGWELLSVFHIFPLRLQR